MKEPSMVTWHGTVQGHTD